MIEKILNNLSNVRKKSHLSYVACCPAHNDKSPSLAIREIEGERILIKCFAGCSVQAVLSAIVLEMIDLFPPKPKNDRGGYKRISKPFTADQLLAIIEYEASYIEFISQEIVFNEKLSIDDYARVILAKDRIQKAIYYAQY